MNFKWIVFIFAIHILAANISFAEGQAASSGNEVHTPITAADLGEQVPAATIQNDNSAGSVASTASPDVNAAQAPVDQCAVTLPELEAQYMDLDRQSRASDKVSQENYRNYVNSFNGMTQVLFELAEAKREEMQRINEAEETLKNSLSQFNANKNQNTSKLVQDQYMNLTVRLYSSAMDGQKTVDQLKKSLAQVEVARAEYDAIKAQPVDWDHKRLDLEGKIISLKIRCRR